MRINIYSQELITDPYGEMPDYEAVNATADTGVIYSGVRMFFQSPAGLHSSEDDDDRSAITFWLPKSEERREYLAEIFDELAALIRLAPEETGLD